MALPGEPSSANAVHQFPSVPELVLCALDHLQTHDLLAVSRTNKYIRAIIRQSSQLVSRLARGPIQRYSDLPAHSWTLKNVRLNTKTFPEWFHGGGPCNIACLDMAEIGTRSSTTPIFPSGSILVPPNMEQELRVQVHTWPAASQDTVAYDPIRNQHSSLDRTVRNRLEAFLASHGDTYLRDPPLPSTITFHHKHRGFAETKVGLCTFGEIVNIALSLCEPLHPPQVYTCNEYGVYSSL